jgi:hypothetical protein
MFTQPYNESQIITLITQYYHLLISLSYIHPTYIDFPPPCGRQISPTLCTSLNLTPQAISLMKHLPCPIDEHVMLDNEFFLPNSLGSSFCSERLIRMGRDPEIAGEREGWLGGSDVAVTVLGDEGICVVVDTAKSKFMPAIFSWVFSESADTGDRYFTYNRVRRSHPSRRRRRPPRALRFPSFISFGPLYQIPYPLSC